MNTETVVIQLGNSDNKLSQIGWSQFVFEAKLVIERNVQEFHFFGGSSFDSPWQNACWVCEVLEGFKPQLESQLTECRKAYRQDSVAITYGETRFI